MSHAWYCTLWPLAHHGLPTKTGWQKRVCQHRKQSQTVLGTERLTWEAQSEHKQGTTACMLRAARKKLCEQLKHGSSPRATKNTAV